MAFNQPPAFTEVGPSMVPSITDMPGAVTVDGVQFSSISRYQGRDEKYLHSQSQTRGSSSNRQAAEVKAGVVRIEHDSPMSDVMTLPPAYSEHTSV